MGLTPQISALAYQQGSQYQVLTANPNGSGFAVIVTPAGNQTTQVIRQNYPSTTTGGTITTLVLVDILGGGQTSTTPIALSDLF